MLKETVRREIADRWAGAACTLNGESAKIVGRLNQYATVASFESTLSAEYAWETVNRIMSADAAFNTN